VLLALGVKAPQFLAPMGQDQGLYHTVGQIILAGGVPYRDAWDPKPPGVFYSHAAVLALAGSDPWRVCGIQLGNTRLQPRCGALLFHAIDFAYALGLGVLAWSVARRQGFGAGPATLAFGLTSVFVNLALLDPEGSTPEKYALGPAIAVILAGLAAERSGNRWWLILAGGLAALAALLKPPDLASFGALSLWLLLQRKGRDLAWLWAPLLVVLGGVWAIFSLMGAGAPFVEATVTYNFARFGFQSQRIPFAAVIAAWQVFRDGLAVLWLPALLGALAGILVAPQLFLDVNFMGGVLVYSFAAASLGGFDSPKGAVIGGWIIGVTENLAGTYVDFIGSDLKILVPLGVILVVLLIRPSGLFGSPEVAENKNTEKGHARNTNRKKEKWITV